MIATIMLGLISTLFAYLSKYRNLEWGLKVSFVLIYLFLALRYNFGNDYEGYREGFIRIAQYDQVNFYDFMLLYEPGWVLLNWLFKPIGFFAMTAVLAFFSCVVYYRFIIKYVPVRYYWLAIFMYIFYPDFMLVHSSTMRQSIAIMLFVFSLDYLYKRDAIRYFLCIGLASLFHFTAIILAPVYLLTFINQKISKIYGAIFVSIFVSLFLFGESLSPYFKLFISGFSEKYEFYQDAGVVNTGFGFLYYSALFIIILYFERLQNREVALVFKIAIISFMVMPLTLIVEMLSRLGMYFAPATIIAYPNILKTTKKPVSKVSFTTILLVITIYQFINFFFSDTYKDYFGTYQTIFSAPQWY
jgi:hypothetical protein